MIKVLLDRGANPNRAGKDGHTPLSVFVNQGQSDNIQILKVLLDGGADPNIADREGKTLLHWALLNSPKGVVKLLKDNGAV